MYNLSNFEKTAATTITLPDNINNEHLSVGKLIEIINKVWPDTGFEYVEVSNTESIGISIKKTDDSLDYLEPNNPVINCGYKVLRWLNTNGRLSLATMQAVATKEFPETPLADIAIYDCLPGIAIAAPYSQVSSDLDKDF